MEALHVWLSGFGLVERVGVEGTGAHGARLARDLRRHGLEVDRPNRQARRRHGKSDPADAVEAARAALSGRAGGVAKTADGAVEAIRVLLVAPTATIVWPDKSPPSQPEWLITGLPATSPTDP